MGVFRDSLSVAEDIETPDVKPREPYKGNMPKLAKRDLLEEEHLRKIRTHMEGRFGIDDVTGYTDEELVEAYVNKQRRFQAGQSVVTLSELAWLNKADEQTRREAGEAYELFDNMENIFTGKRSTFLERLDGVTDYARAAIVDPANLIGLGAGRLVAGIGAKTAAVAAKKLAIKATKDDLINKGSKLGGKALQNQAEKEVAKLGERHFIKEGIKTFGEAESKKLLGKEVGTVALTDMAVSMGVDVAYQHGMIKSMQQEDWSEFQTGLSAIGGIIAPAIVLATKTGSPVKYLTNRFLGADKPTIELADKIAKEQAKKKKLLRESTNTFSTHFEGFFAAMKTGVSFSTKERGKVGKQQIEMMDAEDSYASDAFWNTFLMGNDELGVEGLVHVLNRLGIRYEKARNPEDTFSNFLSDIIANMNPEDMGKFVNVMKSKDIKKRLPNFDQEFKKWKKNQRVDYYGRQGVSKEDIDGIASDDKDFLGWFADSFAAHFSQAGRRLQLLKDGQRILGAKGQAELTAEITLEEGLNPLKKSTLKEIGKRGEYFQRTIIRNLVTNPGTTALNLIGYSGYTTLQSAADVIKAALFVPASFVQASAENMGIKALGSGAESMNKFKSLMGLQRQKVRNILDINTTHESFMDYIDQRPEVMNKMMRYIAGGVDSKEMIKKLGFDPEEKVFESMSEKYTDFFQTIYATKAQDMLTKSVEFMYNIDKGLRLKYGRTYNDLVETGDIDKLLSTEDYIRIEAGAVDDTMEAVFGRKFGKTGPDASYLQKTANFIEEFRTIPVIGLAMPFGQFFNNTVAFVSNYSGIGLINRVYQRGGRWAEDTFKVPETRKLLRERGLLDEEKIQAYIDQHRRYKGGEKIDEGLIKFGIGMAYIKYQAHKELEFMDQGLAWDQERGDGGETITKQYDFPESLFKYAGRMYAHKVIRKEEPPQSMYKVFWDVFGLGQADRSLGVYERGIGNFMFSLANGELDDAMDYGGLLVGEIAQTAAGGVFRPIDPLNQVIALAEGENYVNVDRRQGNKVINNSLRYVDRVVENMLPYDSTIRKALTKEEKKYATRDFPNPAAVGKIVGYREVGKQSYTERMFNMIGKENWRVGFFGGIPEADAKLNAKLFHHLERRARLLVGTKEFKDLSTSAKKKKVDRILKLAKKDTKDNIRKSIVIEDRELELMYTLDKKYNDREVDKALKDLNLPEELDELNFRQLNLLEAYMDGSDDYIKRTTY